MTLHWDHMYKLLQAKKQGAQVKVSGVRFGLSIVPKAETPQRAAHKEL